MSTLWNGTAITLVGLAVGCSSVKKPPVAPAGAMENGSQQPAVATGKAGDNPTRSQIVISDDIKRACGLSDADAHFAFDSARVQEHDRSVLGRVAECFVKGALAGKEMKLVGHADPRGDDEYNMVLGGRRADNVKHVIVSVGMPTSHVSSTSRGELDATGTDEASWARDRRVDVMMGG